MSVGPVAHLARRGLPWRAPELTECGKQLADYSSDRITTLDAVQKLVRDVGAQRASFGLCMTCCNTRDAWALRRSSWADEDGVQALQRECAAVQHATPPMPERFVTEEHRERWRRSNEGWDRQQKLVAELEAIGALVEAHRDEFDGYLAGRAEAPSLSAARAKRRRRLS